MFLKPLPNYVWAYLKSYWSEAVTLPTNTRSSFGTKIWALIPTALVLRPNFTYDKINLYLDPLLVIGT